jgi:four helix bundle protein
MSQRTDKFILDLSHAFALKIVLYAEELEKVRYYDEAGTIFKSGTSIGASIREAQMATDKDSFIYNLVYAVKEAEGTENLLKQYKNTSNYPDVTHLLKDISIMKRFLNDILESSENRSYIKSMINR